MPAHAPCRMYSVVSEAEKIVGPFDSKWKAGMYAVLAEYVTDIRILTHTDDVVWGDSELPPLLSAPTRTIHELVTHSAEGVPILHMSAETLYETEFLLMKVIDEIKEFLGMLGHEDLMQRIFNEVSIDDWDCMLYARILINNFICEIHDAQIRGHA